ncbi:MAG: pilus assembly protein N-terminal domain-containing protein [Planctomycetia bacterium]|nr:pilus assembly protein N-terminal domain-containing protein [Planctomycetia bacterium]
MSTSRTTQFGVPQVLALLAIGIFFGFTTSQVRGEDSDLDLLFECVQTTYGPAESDQQSVSVLVADEEKVADNKAEEVKESDLILEEVAPVAEAKPIAKQEAEPKVKAIAKQEAEPKVKAPVKSEPVLTVAAETKKADVVETTLSAPETITPVQAITPAPQQMAERVVPQPAGDGPVVREPEKVDSMQLSAIPSETVAQPMPRTGNLADDQSLEEEANETVGPFHVYRESEEITVISKRSMLMRTRHNLIRTAIVDPSICDIVQFTPREISIIGRSVGSTHVTFWFEDGTFKPITFVVHTRPDPSLRDRRAEQFKILEGQIAQMFPNSKVTLMLLANKLIIRGQVRSAEEAAEILRILREETSNNNSYATSSNAINLDEETGMPISGGLIIVNQLRVPGIQQVALKVKLADLSRSNGTASGVHFAFDFHGDKLMIQNLMGALNSGGGLLSYTSSDIRIGIDYLVGQGVVRQMSESTLVTMSGTSASMVAGGEIPIQTINGISGASAVTTDFRPYGTVINFTPTVLDKDLIRLYISSEFSSLSDSGNDVTGVPNLDSRNINSEVQMREGQTFALGTTLEDNYSASNSSNIPIFSQLLGNRNKARGEREMVVLVSPELVAPMEPDEVPPLPGFDVTEPTNAQFHILGRLEGTPTRDYRSTVWPSLRNRYLSGGSAIISGPYGH